jgi:hypothetical protein
VFPQFNFLLSLDPGTNYAKYASKEILRLAVLCPISRKHFAHDLFLRNETRTTPCQPEANSCGEQTF